MIFKVFLLSFLFIEVVVIFGNSQTLVGEPCKTPNNQNGICIKAKECASALERLRRRTEADINYLRQSFCGFSSESSTNPKVCCELPPSQHTVTTRPLSQPTNPFALTSSSRIDLRYHRNAPKINSQKCGHSYIDKIADGDITNLFEYPWMALISYRDQYGQLSFRCAGTLISEYYVLTAAHCVYNLEEKERLTLVGVRLGEHNADQRTDCRYYLTATGETKKECATVQDTRIEKIIPHSDYRNISFEHVDMALIKLATPANLAKKNIATVCLPLGIRVKSKHGTVTGWGATEFGLRSNILLKAEMRFMSSEDCAKTYRDISSEQVCALGLRGDPCSGDSGGPIVALESIGGSDKNVQLGIVSVGTSACGLVRRPTVFTNVARNVEWILDNID